MGRILFSKNSIFGSAAREETANENVAMTKAIRIDNMLRPQNEPGGSAMMRDAVL